MMFDPIKLTQALVRIPSVSGNEAEITAYLFDLLSNLALNPIEIDNGIVVRIKGKDHNSALIFNGHIDTVPPGDLGLWHYPPNGLDSGQISNGKIYGLGSSDMKCAVAAMIGAALQWKDKVPPQDVWLSFVAQEETTGQGSKSFIEWFEREGFLKSYKKMEAVLGEPTNLDEIVLGNRGSTFANLTFHGDSGHGSAPEKVKTNAINSAVKALQVIENNKDYYLSKYRHERMGAPSLGVTAVSAGSLSARNKFPDSCTIAVDIRTVPGMDGLSPEKILRDLIGDAEFTYDGPDSIKPMSAPFTSESDPLITKLKSVSGINKTSTKRSTTDMSTFSRKGIPACIFGPGNPAIIHKPDEYCEIKNIFKAEEIYRQVIADAS